ncbi:hypothetical protein GDO86_008740 [Hymenochirus boettgeri]|uniref:Uncharacterized protein n=1 Tax=Hymenochirus boettgeri TaxID=247094 RepID=A0A8T2J489_9PIPI|nr:hypothetical protein GDO86_008740 [Hymenochirus boettgeri]
MSGGVKGVRQWQSYHNLLFLNTHVSKDVLKYCRPRTCFKQQILLQVHAISRLKHRYRTGNNLNKLITHTFTNIHATSCIKIADHGNWGE